MSCLIVFCSLTHAQNIASILRRNGISAVMTKPPLSLGRGSCAHGLLVGEDRLYPALDVIGKTSKKPLGIFVRGKDNIWKELML